ARVDPPGLGVLAEAPGRHRPEVVGRAVAESALVALQGLRILLEEARAVAGGRAVMERPSQHLGAEMLPIIAAVGEMEMPGLVDGIGRRDFVAGGRGE